MFINSTEVGIKKPDPRIFLFVCKGLNVKPEECLFKDDSLENIRAAINLGMETVWWNKEIENTILLKESLTLIKGSV